MKSKRKLVVIISVILFLAVLLLGANTVFSVSQIEIAYVVSSEQAKNDSFALQSELEEAYVGNNIFFIKQEDVTSRFAPYSYLQVKSFEKSYPNKLKLTVEEKMETFALSAVEGEKIVYYMTDLQGRILRKKDANVNNVDGRENFLIEGLRYSGNGFSGDGNFSTVMSACAKMEELTGGIRTCLTQMTVFVPTSNPADSELIVKTREGVTIHIVNPSVLTVEKTEAVMEYYFSLSTADKLYGDIYVLDSNGSVVVS
ncbi:MAG: hypothetical protein IJY26_01795 [Clostridia bacterium]|nr:hypothetical protein [Clostridia bacterium]